jgi:hypothetical protein
MRKSIVKAYLMIALQWAKLPKGVKSMDNQINPKSILESAFGDESSEGRTTISYVDVDVNVGLGTLSTIASSVYNAIANRANLVSQIPSLDIINASFDLLVLLRVQYVRKEFNLPTTRVREITNTKRLAHPVVLLPVLASLGRVIDDNGNRFHPHCTYTFNDVVLKYNVTAEELVDFTVNLELKLEKGRFEMVHALPREATGSYAFMLALEGTNIVSHVGPNKVTWQDEVVRSLMANLVINASVLPRQCYKYSDISNFSSAASRLVMSTTRG